jgi:putative CocE/NonD family hydrolase
MAVVNRDHINPGENRMRLSNLPLCLAIGLAITPPLHAENAAPPTGVKQEQQVQFQWGVKIPLRDGIELNGTLYRPLDQKDPLPCVFTLTPYISASYHPRGMYFAANGYVFATIDVRGRGNSGGNFTPLLQEAKDGHDIVEWFSKQPYCNGKVTMWGGSYAGYNQWATAKEFPSALATIVPVASPKPGVDFPMANNIFYSYDMTWLTLVSGRAAQEEIFGDGDFWGANFERWYRSHAPFKTLDQVVGNPSPIFQTWISHPMQDAYWDSYSPTPEQYAKLDLPILSVTGQYDGDQPGALEFYAEHMQYGSAAAKAKHFLVIGPWDHPGTRTPRAEFGGITFGAASVLDMNALHKAWYDWTLKNGKKPEFLKDRVAFYVSGEEAWRYAPSLETVTARSESWYLDSTASRANSVFASGDLSLGKPGSGKPDSFIHDPLDISSLTIKSLKPPAGDYLDQRATLTSNGTQLVYHTPMFDKDTDLAGFFRLSAYIGLDQPDADLSASIHEIKADGTSLALSSDDIRARYRESLRKAKPVKPGAIERYDFDSFNFIAQRINKGSRLRLVIRPVNSMHSEKNYNSGGVVAEESGKDARKVRVTLYHDAKRPSMLQVPLATASSVPAAAQ